MVSETTTDLARLSMILNKVMIHDQDYDVRYRLVFRALAQALQCGLPAGVRIDPAEPEWPVAYIELSTGQVSWHVPQHPDAWDEHTTEEKFQRIKQFCARVADKVVNGD